MPLIHLIGITVLLVAFLRQLAFWQRKEYRFDRVWASLTSQEVLAQTSPFIFLFYGSVALGWIGYLLNAPGIATFCGGLGLAALLCAFGLDNLRRGLVRPRPTPKLLLLAGITLLLVGVSGYLWMWPPNFLPLQWATFIYFLPLYVSFSVAITNLPASLRQRQVIQQAQTLRRRLRKLEVIGITGSFGKSSTKHFLKQIMQSNRKGVRATKNHRNAEFTVAQDMIEQLRPRTNLYIAEMGAYRHGEIAALARLTQPKHGLITAISNQHAGIFGSQQAIAATKWELIKSLPKDGTAILNADDPTLAELGPSAPCSVIWYSTQEPADVRLSNITYYPDRTAFTLRLQGKQRQITTPIISAGLTQSLAAASAAAHALGQNLADIAESLRQLQPLPHTMEYQIGPNKSVIIDDSYSASEGSVVNALEHLQHFDHSDQRIALVPIIELGPLGPEVHQRIGKLLGNRKAQVFIYGHAYKADIKKGINQSKKRCQVQWYHHPTRFSEDLTRDISDQTLILLEGRLPNLVHQALDM